MNSHPITPPPHDLVTEWEDDYHGHMPEWVLRHVATEAARWGADQELEACVEWIKGQHESWVTSDLRAARRPKPLSLKQQALDSLRTIESNIPQNQRAFEESCEHIRRALEQLDE